MIKSFLGVIKKRFQISLIDGAIPVIINRTIKSWRQSVTDHLFCHKRLRSIYFARNAKGAYIEMLWWTVQNKWSVTDCLELLKFLSDNLRYSAIYGLFGYYFLFASRNLFIVLSILNQTAHLFDNYYFLY